MRSNRGDRSLFYQGLVDKYSWRDVGSSYLPSGILAAFLLEQLRQRQRIQSKRQQVFETYQSALAPWAAANGVQLPTVPEHCEQAYHMFYMLLPTAHARSALLRRLKEVKITATFHYIPLHTSPMGQSLGGREGQCPVTEDVSARLIRLPFFNSLSEPQQAPRHQRRAWVQALNH